MHHFLLVLQYLLTGNLGSMARMGVGSLLAWFFFCDFWVLKFFPENRWWTENMDQFAFMFAAFFILVLELGCFLRIDRGSRRPTPIQLVIPGACFDRREWVAMFRAIAGERTRPSVMRRFFEWQTGLLRPRWLRILWRLAGRKGCPKNLRFYLQSHENQKISRQSLPGIWWGRPWRWMLWLWLPGLCLFLALNALPSLAIEKIGRAITHQCAEGCPPRFWAIDISGFAVPPNGPITPVTLGLKPVPGPEPVFLVPPGLGPLPAVLHLFAEDLPRSGRRVHAICLADDKGSPSLTCTFPMLGSVRILPGTSHGDLRRYHAQFEIHRVRQNNSVLPLKLLFILQRRDGIGIGNAIVREE